MREKFLALREKIGELAENPTESGK
jgi:hypothetical protein